MECDCESQAASPLRARWRALVSGGDTSGGGGLVSAAVCEQRCANWATDGLP